MRILYCCSFFLWIVSTANAQIWTGALSSDWNTPGNWDTGNVPNAAGLVIINSTAANWPSLSGDITVTGFRMNSGSQINLNGRTITAGGVSTSVVFEGAVIHGNGQFNLLGTALKGINGTTVNGNLVINVNGSSNFQEATLASNTFNGHLTINMNQGGDCILGDLFPSSYNGNITINRSVAGRTTLFSKGMSSFTGNFSYTNNAGGLTTIGTTDFPMAPINGTFNIDYSAGNTLANFIIRGVKNLTNGGSIRIRGKNNFMEFLVIRKDTLLVDSLVAKDFLEGQITENRITGNLLMLQYLPTGAMNFYFAANTIHGNSTLGTDGNAYTFLESDNEFHGNTSLDLKGFGGVWVGYPLPSGYHGNLTINSTRNGNEQIFEQGYKALDGDFSYTGNGGATPLINQHCLNLPAISGKINIELIYAGLFIMRRIKNNTPGGYIRAQKCTFFQLTRDTLQIDSLVLREFSSTLTDLYYDSLYFNSISGNVLLEDVSGYYYKTLRLGRNIIGGSSNITILDARTVFSNEGGNTFNGNVEINFGINTLVNEGGVAWIDNLSPSSYHGDLKITRVNYGSTYIFERGITALDGNFTYVNKIGGITHINPDSYPTGLIGKKIFIDYYSPDGNSDFNMRRIRNAQGGGSVEIRNSNGVSFFSDTLIVDSVVVRDFSNPATTSEHGLANCKITGNLVLADKASNNRPIYLFGNIIEGNTYIQLNSNAAFNQGFFNRDRFNGNLRLVKNGSGAMTFSGPVHFDGDLIMQSTAGISFSDTVYFGGSSNSTIEQLGTQSILIPRMAIRKTNNSSLTLMDSVAVSTILRFESGNINAVTRPLRFADNATHTGASANSHVIGKVLKAGNDAFSFPVGTASTLNAVSMTAPANTTDLFAAEYLQRNPTTDGYNAALFQQIGPNPIQRVSNCEYWNLQRLNGSSNVGLTFSFGDAVCPPGSSAYITNPAKAKIVHWNGSLWEDLGNGGYTGAAIGTVSTAAAVSNFSPFTLASTDLISNPLPLTLLSFNAYRNGQAADLKWETVNEQNVSHYEIQRAGNDQQFAAIGTVMSVNSVGHHIYRFTDRTPNAGLNFYRMMSVDIDGKIGYSKVVVINYDDQLQVQLWPNPVSRGAVSRLFIPGGNGLMNIRMLNSQGKLVRQWNNVNAGHLVEMNTGELPVGIYLLQVGELKTIKLIIN